MPCGTKSYFNNPETPEILRELKDKICSVFCKSNPLTSPEEEVIHNNYYVCKILHVNEDGIFGTHPEYGVLNFYPWKSIVSIHQELIKKNEENTEQQS